MNDGQLSRRLAAILQADVVGYSGLMEQDEVGTLARLRAHRQDLIDPATAAYHGRLVKLMGDGALVEFPSVVDALACALTMQQGMAQRNRDVPESVRIELRIGVNLGDIMLEDNDIYGDGVNVAARLEALAEPGGVCVSEAVRSAVGSKLPLDYEDLGEQQVKNIAEPVHAYHVRLAPGASLAQRTIAPTASPIRDRRGLLVAAAAALVLIVGAAAMYWLQPWAPRVAPTAAERTALPLPDKSPLSLPDKPSIAVLPFDNMSGDPEQAYFADGITEDLTTDLSKIPDLFVIARNSAFAYKGRSIDIGEIAKELGVRYILEGSVRRGGDQIRINAQLIDATTGGHLWAERYDRKLTDVFAIQDAVTESIVAALALNITANDSTRTSRRKPTTSIDAYDMLLRGLELYQRFNPTDNTEARAYFTKAVALDPNYARAHANIAWTHAAAVTMNWIEDPAESIRLGLEAAADAQAIDASLPLIYLTYTGFYLAQKQYESSADAARHALELDPNYVDGYTMLAFSLVYAGALDEALDAIHTAKRLNPRYSYIYLFIEGHARFLLGQYEVALPLFKEVVERNAAFDRGHLLLAATYAQLGSVSEAIWAIEEARFIRPNISIADEEGNSLYQRPEDLDRYLNALRKAGLGQ